MFLFLSLLSLSSSRLDSVSFSGNFIPEHMEKYHTLGDALPMRRFVRLNPPRASAGGALVTSSPVNASTFEIETTINFGSGYQHEHAGMSLWLSNSTFRLGPMYGLSSDFQGVAAIIDIHAEKIFLLENYEELSFEIIFNSTAFCPFSTRNKQAMIELKVKKENIIEVWTKERKMHKCAEVYCI